MTALKQRIILTNPNGEQLSLAVDNKMNLPMSLHALAVPVAWLLQLYATLDGQPNSLSQTELKHDVQSILVRHTKLTLDDIKSINVMDRYEYQVTLMDELGRLYTETLVGTDDGHAKEEASYEFSDECVAVKKGERIPDPPPWHEWPK